MTGDANVGLFDLDSSLADYEGQLLIDMDKLRAPDEPIISMRDLQDDVVPPHLKARVRLIKHQPGWWRNLPTISQGMWVLNVALGLEFDCMVLTNGPKTNAPAWQEKVEWCDQKLPDKVRMTITRDKSIVYGKFLYDDFVPYVEPWLKHRRRGIVIMPDCDHNRGFAHPRVVRYDGRNKQQVVDALLAVHGRKPGEPLKGYRSWDPEGL